MGCKRFLVSGRVQGVYFRAHTQQRAERLKLTGWVRNLRDGRVEVLACGDDAAVTALQEWLWQGPELARVSAVSSESAVIELHSDFRIL
ncbi:MAG: acylphosphatase [Gammaproteobacteria bacterium]